MLLDVLADQLDALFVGVWERLADVHHGLAFRVFQLGVYGMELKEVFKVVKSLVDGANV